MLLSARALLRCLLLLSLTLTLLLTLGTARAATPVLIVTSEEGGAYGETIDALRQALAGELSSGDFTVIGPESFADAELDGTRIVVTVGTQAAASVGKRPVSLPVLNTLLPHDAYEPEAGKQPNAAIFLDQPISRQVDAIREALPQWRRVAIIAGPQTLDLARAFQAQAEKAGLEVRMTAISSEHELYHAMQTLLAEPAILVALPDRVLFNSYTIQNILLTTYRLRSPVFGFSPAYTRAGALLAVHTSPTQIGAQAAQAVRRALLGQGLPRTAYPAQFEISVNSTVARSLGIDLDSPEVIADRIRKREHKP